jgi:hypothetical protein
MNVLPLKVFMLRLGSFNKTHKNHLQFMAALAGAKLK